MSNLERAAAQIGSRTAEGIIEGMETLGYVLGTSARDVFTRHKALTTVGTMLSDPDLLYYHGEIQIGHEVMEPKGLVTDIGEITLNLTSLFSGKMGKAEKPSPDYGLHTSWFTRVFHPGKMQVLRDEAFKQWDDEYKRRIGVAQFEQVSTYLEAKKNATPIFDALRSYVAQRDDLELLEYAQLPSPDQRRLFLDMDILNYRFESVQRPLANIATVSFYSR